MKIWHLSDTHGLHKHIEVPGCDLVIFSGDGSNSRNVDENQREWASFTEWFGNLPIKHKVLTFGNHETWAEKNLGLARDNCATYGIICLVNESCVIEGLKIWGSPYTPRFFDWAFNCDRDKIGKIWAQIPNDTDIVVTHGPPRGILDLTYDGKWNLEQAGCGALARRIEEIKPRLCLAGHLHKSKEFKNNAVLTRGKVIYSNASCADNNYNLVSEGHLFEVKGNKISHLT